MLLMFSVVIPLYNKSSYIKKTLESVLNQVLPEFEVVVVDDGSSDNGAQVVSDLADTDGRIRLIRQANAGVSAARNAGIAAAQGDWVAFLDADDWWHPTHLEQLARAAQLHPHADVIATGLRRVPDAPNWNPLPWPEQPATPDVLLIKDLPARWMQGIPFCSSSVAVRRQALLAMQPCFPVGESRGEDLEVWFRLAEHSDIAHVQATTSAYRTAAANSLTAQHASRALAPFLLRMASRAKKGEMSLHKRASALHLVAHQKVTFAREALSAGYRFEGFQWLWRSREACFTKRWVVTLAMLLVPAAGIRRWEAWRNARTSSI